jgi:hypothetical protein
MLTIADVEDGAIVETLIFGKPTGNLYKIGALAYAKHRYGWCRFIGERRPIHTAVKCRLVTDWRSNAY